MNFSQILEELKKSAIVTRSNLLMGNIVLMPGYKELNFEQISENTVKNLQIKKGEKFRCDPYLLKIDIEEKVIPNNNIIPEYYNLHKTSMDVPTNEDLFAEDWYVVSEKKQNANKRTAK